MADNYKYNYCINSKLIPLFINEFCYYLDKRFPSSILNPLLLPNKNLLGA